MPINNINFFSPIIFALCHTFASPEPRAPRMASKESTRTSTTTAAFEPFFADAEYLRLYRCLPFGAVISGTMSFGPEDIECFERDASFTWDTTPSDDDDDDDDNVNDNVNDNDDDNDDDEDVDKTREYKNAGRNKD